MKDHQARTTGFLSQQLGVPYKESEQERAIRLLAEEYHRRTEEFDQSRCQHRKNGVAIPISQEEIRDCTANARALHAELFTKAQTHGCTFRMWIEASARSRPR